MDVSSLSAAGMTVSTGALDLQAYRRDLWPRTALEQRAGTPPPSPAAVCWPTCEDDVAAALAWAAREGAAVVPYGAGSGVCGAAGGRHGALVIDTKRMNRLLQIDPDTCTARVQPGLLGQHLEDQLAHHGWMTAHSPSSIMCSTVGGWIAARSAGQFSSRYGVFDDMLLAARAVCPTGRIDAGAWTPAGAEDLLPMLQGSEGALGVVTEALVRIAPLPEQRWLRGYAFPDLESAWTAIRRIMQADLWPSAIRLYDPVDTRLAGKAHPKTTASPSGEPAHPLLGSKPLVLAIRRAVEQVPALRHRVLDLPLALPGLVNRLAEGLGSEVLLILGFEGPSELVAIQTRTAAPLLAAGRDLGPAPGERWFAHRHDVSYKAAPIFVAGGFADTMEVATTWSRLPELHEQVRAALAEHAIVMAHFSHAYPEGCSIYFSFVGAGRIDVYDRAWADALAAARTAGGTVTHHHGVGPLKAVAAAREAGAAVRVWRDVKARLDPTGIMNPDRLFPEAVPVEAGPPPPDGGPVFAIDRDSLLAEVDPHADPATLAEALAAEGLALRIPPDRPLADWLAALQRGALQRWEVPLFAVQARFDDGVSVRLGHAPRSAAGPDLRWGLLRRARAELVQVPVRPLHDEVRFHIARRPFDLSEARPLWTTGDEAALAGPTAPQIARLFSAPAVVATVAGRTPTRDAALPRPGGSEDP